MTAMTSSGAVDAALVTLRDRVAKELGRLRAPSTMRIGGLARVAGCLDQLLRALAQQICEEEGLSPDQWLSTHGQSRSATLQRSSAWQIAIPLRELLAGPRRRHHARAWILNDLDSPASAIKRVVTLRNPVLHGEREPDEASMKAALQPLYELLAHYVPADLPSGKKTSSE